eukprot:TRINITY_DN14636_c0_g1_i1.p1 TRINITY_DN14636_c0_g1~~TRINITY_DN14636_c0_g1_i1.p1  ORF type:complete len:168 (+),score=18.37 TRINITY_DN14636_c0_g1_i1:14-517(+)
MSEEAYFAGGCFWCLDSFFQTLPSVTVTCGYAGGAVVPVSYEAVCGGATGHAEVVKLSFNPQVISYAELLKNFWKVHDPTQLNRQGNDIGDQYRSAIFYTNEHQKAIAEASMKEAQGVLQKPIVTQIVQLKNWCPAEDYHQNYFANHPENAYCKAVIAPKLKKLIGH